MVTFCVIVTPLPYAIRKRMFQFLSESPIIAKIAYGLKISFMYVFERWTCIFANLSFRFIGILFVDALQRMFRVTAEADLAKSGAGAMADVRTETNFAARKF